MSYRFTDSEILLSPQNPYFGGNIILVDDMPELAREFIEWEGDKDDFFHTVEYQDTIESIAGKYYTNRVASELAFQYWWLIADANNIENLFDLSSLLGTEIVVPNITRFLTIRQQTR